MHQDINAQTPAPRAEMEEMRGDAEVLLFLPAI